jgi:hypothetical protein
LDLRGHIFNDGKYAANLGMGLRWLPDQISEVFGINFYYDYRQASKKPYNQVSMGLEALGEKWDFRANGYLTVGNRHTHAYDYFFDMNTFELSAKREFSMSGADAEVGYHFCTWNCIDFYPAIGPYYYHSSSNFEESTFGGRARLEATIYTYVTLEGILTYDHIFKWIGQGAISLNFPFGPGLPVKQKPCGTCFQAYTLGERLLQHVQHNEIIVVDERRKQL